MLKINNWKKFGMLTNIWTLGNTIINKLWVKKKKKKQSKLENILYWMKMKTKHTKIYKVQLTHYLEENL